MEDKAINRAWELMHIPLKDLPPLALELRNKMARELGMCMEVCLTAFACYAQVVEGLECKDDLYQVRESERAWLLLKMKDSK